MRDGTRRMAVTALAAASVLAASASIAGCGSSGTNSAAGGQATRSPSTSPAAGSASQYGRASTTRLLNGRIRHVWIIELENTSFQHAYSHPSVDPELASTLPAQGALLENYYAVGHFSLDNYIAQVSGQAPDQQTAADCGTFWRFTPTGPPNQYGQLPGSGCVYPASVPTIASELTAAHLTWKAYEQQMGNVPARDGTVQTPAGPACGHPPLGVRDPTDLSKPANDSYSTRHDPFMYFLGVIGNASYCQAHVVSLKPLAADLRSVRTTPNYSWITPDTCSDGHDPICHDGAHGGLRQINAFLSTWVPRITASPAYRSGGLIIITTDESASTDASACCGEATIPASHPNLAQPGQVGPGGGQVGAVLLSPFIQPGTVSTIDYNHFSLLKSVEEIFGVPLLGDAQLPQVPAFGSDVFTAPNAQ